MERGLLYVVFAAAVAFLPTQAVFALSSYVLGGTTYYSDGSSSYNLGGTTYYRDNNGNSGSAYNLGGTTYFHDSSGNSGSAYDLGGTTYFHDNNGNSGSAYDLGGTTYYHDSSGNSGSSYNLGGTTYYNGDVFLAHNCPSNSTYDSLSGKCKCSYGYTVSGSSCVYKGSSPVYTASAYNASNSCPLHSHISPSDSTKCLCDTGFQINAAKDTCVAVPVITNDQACSNKYGANSNWDGTKTSDGLLINCGCQSGYNWNSTKTMCILATIQSQTSTEGSPEYQKKVADLQAQVQALIAQLAALLKARQ